MSHPMELWSQRHQPEQQAAALLQEDACRPPQLQVQDEQPSQPTCSQYPFGMKVLEDVSPSPDSRFSSASTSFDSNDLHTCI